MNETSRAQTAQDKLNALYREAQVMRLLHQKQTEVWASWRRRVRWPCAGWRLGWR